MLREKELKWFYQGPGAGYVFPQEWEAYEAAIPENERHDLIAAYGNNKSMFTTNVCSFSILLSFIQPTMYSGKRLRGEMGEEEMMKAAKAWSIWEGRTSKLVQDDWEL